MNCIILCCRSLSKMVYQPIGDWASLIATGLVSFMRPCGQFNAIKLCHTLNYINATTTKHICILCNRDYTHWLNLPPFKRCLNLSKVFLEKRKLLSHCKSDMWIFSIILPMCYQGIFNRTWGCIWLFMTWVSSGRNRSPEDGQMCRRARYKHEARL